jgi:Na+-transporting NADH:ubiquinone oxidoreductase subunit NqrC
LKDPVTLFFILICLIVAAMVVSSWVSAPKPIAPKKELTDAQRVTTAPSLLGSQSENNDSE